MCVAVPMQIISMDTAKGKAVAALNGNQMAIDIRLITPVPGDYVLVHAGCALEIVQTETAEEIVSLFSDLAELAYDGV